MIIFQYTLTTAEFLDCDIISIMSYGVIFVPPWWASSGGLLQARTYILSRKFSSEQTKICPVSVQLCLRAHLISALCPVSTCTLVHSVSPLSTSLLPSQLSQNARSWWRSLNIMKPGHIYQRKDRRRCSCKQRYPAFDVWHWFGFIIFRLCHLERVFRVESADKMLREERRCERACRCLQDKEQRLSEHVGRVER